jgi:hypothetical protein
MSTTLRVPVSDYNITTLPNNGNPLGNVVITTNTLRIHGNLVADATTALLYSNEPIFTLNANLNAPAPPYQGDSGIEIKRGIENTTYLHWNEVGDLASSWTLSDGYTEGLVLLSTNLQIKETTNSPELRSGYVNVTADTSSVGQSGVYINSAGNVDELATARAARKYAIIFG